MSQRVKAEEGKEGRVEEEWVSMGKEWVKGYKGRLGKDATN